MKKLLGLLLAGVMVLSMSAFVLADSGDNKTPQEIQDILNKTPSIDIAGFASYYPNSWAGYLAWKNAGGALAAK